MYVDPTNERDYLLKGDRRIPGLRWFATNVIQRPTPPPSPKPPQKPGMNCCQSKPASLPFSSAGMKDLQSGAPLLPSGLSQTVQS
jgi:hypothetical protein